MPNKRIIIELGTKFNFLTVIQYDREFSIKNKESTYLCKCRCGVIKPIRANKLLNNHIKSCGCAPKSERVVVKPGDKFNQLTIVKKLVDNQGYSVDEHGERIKGSKYECLCDCGKTTIRRKSLLINNMVQSCGCAAKMNHYIHGLTGTSEYNTFKSKEYREQKKKFDSEWTIKMECSLREFIPFCVWCNSRDNLSVDHVYPLSKGYGLKLGNATILCRSCNSSKGCKDLTELSTEKANILITTANLFKTHYDNTAPTYKRTTILDMMDLNFFTLGFDFNAA